jgi:hypothetical protein
MIRSKSGQRLIGAGILAASLGFCYWEWQTVQTEGYYHKAAVFFAAFAVFGLGAMLFPLDFEKLKAEHGVDKPENFSHYPLEWKVMFVAALAAALGFWYWLAHGGV